MTLFLTPARLFALICLLGSGSSAQDVAREINLGSLHCGQTATRVIPLDFLAPTDAIARLESTCGCLGVGEVRQTEHGTIVPILYGSNAEFEEDFRVNLNVTIRNLAGEVRLEKIRFVGRTTAPLVALQGQEMPEVFSAGSGTPFSLRAGHFPADISKARIQIDGVEGCRAEVAFEAGQQRWNLSFFDADPEVFGALYCTVRWTFPDEPTLEKYVGTKGFLVRKNGPVRAFPSAIYLSDSYCTVTLRSAAAIPAIQSVSVSGTKYRLVEHTSTATTALVTTLGLRLETNAAPPTNSEGSSVRVAFVNGNILAIPIVGTAPSGP